MDYFEYRDSELYVEDVPLSRIAKEVGTPAYVYSEATFNRHLDILKEAFKNFSHIICYSVKVASNLELLRKAGEKGCGADIVSGGELFRALKAGLPANKIVFSGVGKTAREMAEALEAGILMFNVESEAEMELLAKVAADRGVKAPMSFRVNPDVDPKTHPYIATGLKESKFGIPFQNARDLFLRADSISSLKVIGIDCHIGSQLTDVLPFVDATTKLKELLLDLKKSGLSLEYLDIGGGLGISYRDENPPAPDEYAANVIKVVKDIPGLTIIMEPGRVVAGNSAVLLIEVLYNKVTPLTHFVITDGAMNDLIRPSLYGAWHDIWPVKKTGRESGRVNVVGPVCESGDFLAKDRELQRVESGELLAVRSAGAYGFSMSSNYNSRPRAPEVLVNGCNYKVIRTRETYGDLIRGEIL